ncbi:Hypothetical predicted protein [Olea europaea subsp. europaea]|uniref:Uncharacterized protein n=1 Tax=Olea europaea subsp. europaea TaxID=158383 RepID=A0A8S0U1Q9_OLEEU|nr:Hypothetical predicted protein [Olea europaea subsp. europaea]
MFFFLFFQPSSIAFETLQAIMVHGFQFLEIFLLHSVGESATRRLLKLADISPAGSLWEWKGTLIRNLGFFLDVMTLLMAVAHYVYIWWLHGMAFRLVDAVLFLNIRVKVLCVILQFWLYARLSAIVKCVKGYTKLRIALGTLHAALPDATSEELRAYDDDCAICRELMAKAKKLSCNHLLHLLPENGVTPHATVFSTDALLARQISAGLDRPNFLGHAMHSGVIPNPLQNAESGSLWEWKGTLIRNLGFFLDVMTLLMAVAHYVYIWWLRGMAFRLVDAVLFLNIRVKVLCVILQFWLYALLSAIVKCVEGYTKLRIALGTLHAALPDATSEELRAYDDDCAICRELMAKAKKLSCNHLLHLVFEILVWPVQ